MLRDLWGKALCKTGNHEGEWRLVSPDDCTFVYSCVRCDHEEHKVEHEWGDWEYREPHKCLQDRRCTRCGEPDERIEHIRGDVNYLREGSCESEAVCERCGDPARRERHAQARWDYVDADRCLQKEVCGRCGAPAEGSSETRIEHPWGRFEFNSERNAAVRVCPRCGEVEERPREEDPEPEARSA